MKKNARDKMSLARQTLRTLDAGALAHAAGGVPWPPDSRINPCIPPPPAPRD
jgi:hypothetical protein